jgi:Xaa-Pro dipeptidase
MSFYFVVKRLCGYDTRMNFSREEFDSRVAATRRTLVERDLAALLVFGQESHYYLTGYDSSGFVFFQAAVLTADEQPITLLCRRPDVAQARDTSTVDDVRVWLNAEDANPALDLKAIMEEKGLAGHRVGIELDTYGLTASNYRLVESAVAGFCELVDGSDIVRGQRLIKSESELAYTRRAGQLADAAVRAMFEHAAPGVLETELTAAGNAAILHGGGDVAPADPLVNSGSRAVYGRSVGAPRTLTDNDQILVELAGTYHRYNSCIERTLILGDLSKAQREQHAIVKEAQEACMEAFKPGEPLGQVDEVHREILDAAGFAEERFAACGYSLGATFRPSWMDVPPMIYSGNPLEMRPGMVFFPHVMLGDKSTGIAVGLGNTIVVTETGSESMSKLPLDLMLK